MSNADLRERVARAIYGAIHPIGGWGAWVDDGRDSPYHAYADAVLAALGLNDFDAAVERCAQGIVHQEIEDYGWDDERNRPTYPGGLGDLIRERTNLWRDNARRGLEAALTPPEVGGV